MDVYSFGMIMYTMFEHQLPFAGTDSVAAARQAALNAGRPDFVQLAGNAFPFNVRPPRTEILCPVLGKNPRVH